MQTAFTNIVQSLINDTFAASMLCPDTEFSSQCAENLLLAVNAKIDEVLEDAYIKKVKEMSARVMAESASHGIEDQRVIISTLVDVIAGRESSSVDASGLIVSSADNILAIERSGDWIETYEFPTRHVIGSTGCTN